MKPSIKLLMIVIRNVYNFTKHKSCKSERVFVSLTSKEKLIKKRTTDVSALVGLFTKA